ncbi:MAG: hypothetical protein AB1941_01015 [Gemmatimonadota bacterium]
MRRLLALLLLLLTAGSALESVLGELRDGEVHHESGALAALHGVDARGDHGHEDGSLPGNHRHSRGHEHGTNSDHCTHQHGTAMLVTPFEPLFSGLVQEIPPASRSRGPHGTPTPLFHPPRA